MHVPGTTPYAIRDATLKALEFHRIVEVVSSLSVTPAGTAQLAALGPETDERRVRAAQQATSEGVAFFDDHPDFPLHAPEGIEPGLEALTLAGAILEPTQLLALATFLESVAATRTAVIDRGGGFPILAGLAAGVASFTMEIAAVRRAIDPAGEVTDAASQELLAIRDRLRKRRATLRSTLEGFLKGRDAKFLQEQVVTDRHGRYVLMVRTEHRDAIPGIVHGASSSGASLFLEPMGTVAINNDIVALEEREVGEVRRILLALTDAFRGRPDDLQRTVQAATTLDVIQARARFSRLVGGVEPAVSDDGGLVLDAARHPLLLPEIRGRESLNVSSFNDSRPHFPVPVDIRIERPARVLVIAGPNTGGKTVALKTAGLLAMMAQAGLHVPAARGSRLPVFQSVFADIGDEQSIMASLSTFSAHITNVVSMDRDLALPALILLDEVGAGTDPAEGGPLGIAVIDHFRRRGAHLIATTHYDSLKSYASATPGVEGAAFGFDPETFAPTYRLLYGSPGRSLALEIAGRLGMPPPVIEAARGHLTEPEKQLAEHLSRLDRELAALAEEHRALGARRLELAETDRALHGREEAVRKREQRARRRLDKGIDEQVRDARRRIDEVIEDLKARAAELASQSALAPRLNTGATGAVRVAARAAVDAIARQKDAATGELPVPAREPDTAPPPDLAPGVRVLIGALGLEGRVIGLHGGQAEVDVNGKRLRANVAELRAIGPERSGAVRVNVDLAPRDGPLTELDVIGCTVDEALARTEKFLDRSVIGDVHTLRIIHGYGTGQLRRALTAFLEDHPMVAHLAPAPDTQGGGGVTVVELKD